MATVRYWAAVQASAGVSEETYPARTLAELLAAVTNSRSGDAVFAGLITRCAVVVDGTPVSSREPETVPLTAGSAVELLPPFAGG
jgi:sulfur-carrier protein